MLTQAQLKEALRYNSKTGIFTRRQASGGQDIGVVAGSLDAYGYIIIRVRRKSYKAHRLAWLYVYGKFPVVRLDHKNEIKRDNRIKNLRLSSAKLNSENVTAPNANNKSGFRGVTYHKKLNKWQANIRVNKKLLYLGVFDKPKEAYAAYLKAKSIHHIGK